MNSFLVDSWLASRQPLEWVTDKEKSSKAYISYMMIRLLKMFKYEGLPESIPQEVLESYLLINGSCFVTEVDGKLYALLGSAGGEPDAYYRPTRYIVANPYLKLSKEYHINCDEPDGVIMRNDSLWFGLYPLMSRYASQLAENCLTIRTADVMLRVMALLTAPDDATKQAGEYYLKQLEKGKLGVIAENRFFEGIKMQSPPSNNGSYLTQFIELQQYLKGSFFNEIGLNANFNMKREAIAEAESSLNGDSLYPLCEQMLQARKEDVEKINKMFGTNITVEFDSSWEDNQKELEMNLKQLETASQLAETGETSESASQLAESGDEDGTSDTTVLSGDSETDDGTSADENKGIESSESESEESERGEESSKGDNSETDGDSEPKDDESERDDNKDVKDDEDDK